MNIGRISRDLIALGGLIASLAALACDESLTGAPPDPTGQQGQGAPVLSILTGDRFIVTIRDTLPIPIRTRVMTADGRPIRSVWVKYNVVIGSGAFSADSTLTNEQGFTQVLFSPGSLGTVIAEARVGGPQGESRKMVTVQVLNDPNLGSEMVQVSGNAQTGSIGTLLAEPFVVRVLNPDGLPVDSFPVTFAVASADSIAEVVDPTIGSRGAEITVHTDAGGFAKVFLRLGSRPGFYNARATATFNLIGAASTESISFSAFAELPAGAAVRLFSVSGDRQTVRIGIADSTNPDGFVPLENPERPNPLVVQALDRFGNPVPGVTVFWHVTDGGGQLLSTQVLTDQGGFAENVITDVTKGRNLVDAVAPTTNRVTFVIEAVTSPKREEDRPDPGDSGPGREGE